MDHTKRIFIIDDEEGLLSILKEYFEQHDIGVYTFNDQPPELRKELEEKRPHAVLLDITFPRTSGIEILKQIKEIAPRIPVIMMTGHTNDERRVEALRNGAYTILTKPFDSFEELYQVINNAMDHYIETLKTVELTSEIEEKHRLEKINILEIDFLKSLQHMIGEAEDPGLVLKSAYSLLRKFIQFEYFGILLTQQNEVNIQIYPNVGERKSAGEMIMNRLLKRMSRGVAYNSESPEADGYQPVMVELTTMNNSFGFASLFRKSSFLAQEETIFHRFCSYIALTLEKIRLFEEIKNLSIHDGLTGIYNHTYIINKLTEEIERAKRYGSNISVILFDLDDFKEVNDTYGHLAGDKVLRKVAELFLEALRTIDIVGRYGGEEFLVILPETDLEKTYIVGERLRDEVAREDFTYEEHHIKLTISGGIGCYQQGSVANDLIKIADNNLYQSKREGKNRIYYGCL